MRQDAHRPWQRAELLEHVPIQTLSCGQEPKMERGPVSERLEGVVFV